MLSPLGLKESQNDCAENNDPEHGDHDANERDDGGLKTGNAARRFVNLIVGDE